jgi:hypothetical protein
MPTLTRTMSARAVLAQGADAEVLSGDAAVELDRARHRTVTLSRASTMPEASAIASK